MDNTDSDDSYVGRYSYDSPVSGMTEFGSSYSSARLYANVAFDWKCRICNVISKDASRLENEYIAEFGPYTDRDDTQWLKCDYCDRPYHSECLKKRNIPVPETKGVFKCNFTFCSQLPQKESERCPQLTNKQEPENCK